jgi:hypothetical protein
MRKIWIIVTLLLFAAPSLAQDRASDQLALARVAASECGLTGCTEQEVAAIGAVLRARCSSCRLATSARLYSSRVFDQNRTDDRAWIAFLSPTGHEPERWPSTIRVRGERVPHAPWAIYRERWLAIYEWAGRVVRGELAHACEQPPVHWGGPMDDARAARLGLVRVDCGETRNRFYVLPAREALGG